MDPGARQCDLVDYAQELIDQNALLVAALAGGDWTAPVPTCPGWTVLQLLRHVGRGDRWAAQMIRDHAGPELDPRSVVDGRPPDQPEAALAWLRTSPQVIVDAVTAAGLETPVSTFAGPQPARWWLRRRLHEATVHRADVAIALGQAYALQTDVAVDGVAEWLDRVTGSVGTPPLGPGRTFSLVAADRPGVAWHLAGTAGAAVIVEPGAPADVTVAGPAADLLLALTRRRAIDDTALELSGDHAVWDGWLASTQF